MRAVRSSDGTAPIAYARVHLHMDTPTAGVQYSSHLEVLTAEPGVACGHVRMKNELGRRGQPVGPCRSSLRCLFPCM